MKCVLYVLMPALVLLGAAGCDPSDLAADAKDVLTAQGLDPAAVGDLLQTQDRLHLMDGSCDGDGGGSEYSYGPGGYGGDGANGQGTGDRLRLRDGSCDDGSGG